MKILKRYSFLTLMAGMMIMAFMATGCQKDTVTLRAHFEQFHNDNGQKLYVNSSYTPKWYGGEKVYVNGLYSEVSVPTSGTNVTLEASASTDGYVAIFTGGTNDDNPVTNTGGTYSFNVPQTQLYEVEGGNQQIKAPMYAFSPNANTPLEFKNMGAVMKIHLENMTADASELHQNLVLTIDSITVIASHVTLWGNATINLSDPNNPIYTCAATSTTTTEESRKIYLDCSQNTDNPISLGYTSGSNTKDLYICVPPVTSTQENHYSIRVCGHLSDGTIAKYMREQNPTVTYNGSLGRSKIALIQFDVKNEHECEWVPGTLPAGTIENALFTVGSDKQVYFSMGNLQWRACDDELVSTTHAVNDGGTAAGVWRFAPNQWDVCGSDNSNISQSCTTWIDLFGWATSGYNEKFPYWSYISTSNYYEYAGNLSSANGNANYDWGVYNAISNGGNEPNKWRTLTDAEWNHLLNTRTTVDGSAGNDHSYKYVRVKIGTNEFREGLLLFKDGYGSTASVPAYNSSSPTSTTLNSIPNGCVFLPCAGSRGGTQGTQGTTISNIGTYGYYWSATGVRQKQAKAWSFHYTANPVSPTTVYNFNGYSVRLVTDKP